MLPDLIDRCQPIEGSVDLFIGLSNSTICTQTDDAILKDGWRSFFSGHSSCMTENTLSLYLYALIIYLHSVAFAGLGFLSFYLAGKLHLFDRRGHAVSAPNYSLLSFLFKHLFIQAKAWISLTPLAGATLVAISRSMDYRRKYLSLHILPP